MNSYSEWQQLGYQVIKGEKGDWCSEDQCMLFDKDQVRPISDLAVMDGKIKQKKKVKLWWQR